MDELSTSVSPTVGFGLWLGGSNCNTSPGFSCTAGRMLLDFMSKTQATALILGVLCALGGRLFQLGFFFGFFFVVKSFRCFR